MRLQLPSLGADNARRREIAGRYHAAAPGWRWQDDHPDHVFHLCVARVDRRATRCARRSPSAGVATAVHYPLALTEQPAYRAVRTGGRVPRPNAGRPSASRCRASRSSPTTRSTRCGAARPGGQAVAATSEHAQRPRCAAISAFFPCYNDALAIPTMVRGVRRVLAEAVDDFEIIVIDDGSSDGSVEVLQALTVGDPRAAPRRPRRTTVATAAPCCRASPPPRASGSSTPTATRSTTPASSARASTPSGPTPTSCRATSSAAATRGTARPSAGRTTTSVRVLFRLARARHRLRLPPHPPVAARPGRADVDLRRDLRRDDAQVRGRRRPLRGGRGQPLPPARTVARSSSACRRSPARPVSCSRCGGT